ncbi:hypothetical protein MPH_02804 [Macrophomina phaseolina MS6]|uniref:Uncharacterized protein n=1 Tax=Macrophomina phaseolina (strain MS6) TaxID=1126212 RepID=K2S4C3_MACPH|nr:hypothetical protein MPH_02804 [Macrophomina phaseolina MS6]
MEKSFKRLERAWERQSNVLTESNPSQAEDESRFRQMVAEMVRNEVHESENRRREERIRRQQARQASSVSVSETGTSWTAPSSSSRRSPSTSPAPPEPPPTGPSSGPSSGRQNGAGGQQGRSLVQVPFTSPIPNDPSTSPDLRYCYRCGRYHPNVEEDDRDVGSAVTHGTGSSPAPAARPAGSQSDLMHEVDRPRHGEGEIPGDRRMWMRAEGPPTWEERPRGGRGTDNIDDIPPPDRPAK